MIEINRILCPVDFSPYSDRALAYAMKMAAWYGARLQVLHVMLPVPLATIGPLATTSRELTARSLQLAVERSRLPHVEVATEIVESAEPATRILEAADAFDADLIVTGSHGRARMERVLLGSVVEALLHRCARPMLTIPSHLDQALDHAPATFSRIVCAVDFGEPSLTALAHALSIAEEADAQLTVLHVLEPPERHAPPGSIDANQDNLDAACRRRLRALIPENASEYCTVEAVVAEGGVARQVLHMAADRQADLIVLGVRGRNAFDLAFFGSNAKDVIRQARCPVLAVAASRRHAATRAAS